MKQQISKKQAGCQQDCGQSGELENEYLWEDTRYFFMYRKCQNICSWLAQKL